MTGSAIELSTSKLCLLIRIRRIRDQYSQITFIAVSTIGVVPVIVFKAQVRA